jgi:hypothetical protein
MGFQKLLAKFCPPKSLTGKLGYKPRPSRTAFSWISDDGYILEGHRSVFGQCPCNTPKELRTLHQNI